MKITEKKNKIQPFPMTPALWNREAQKGEKK